MKLSLEHFRGAYWVGIDVSDNGLIRSVKFNCFTAGVLLRYSLRGRSGFVKALDIDYEPFTVRVFDTKSDILFEGVWTTNDGIYKRFIAHNKIGLLLDNEIRDLVVVTQKWDSTGDKLVLNIVAFDDREKAAGKSSNIRVYEGWDEYYGSETTDIGEGDDVVVSRTRNKYG